MSRNKESLLCSCPPSAYPSPYKRRDENENATAISTEISSASLAKLNRRFPSSPTYLKFPLRHVILLAFVLTLSSHVHNANSQPLLNQFAVLLRARPPWPTSFPSASSNHQPQVQQQQQPNKQQANFSPNQQQQQRPMQQNQQSIQVQPNSGNVYASSSEQLQNFISSNNLLPLSQGIPVVAMDPSQNSITIVTPAGPPDQIVGPNTNGNAPGGNVFVAQPFQGNNSSQNLVAASSIQQNGPAVQVLPNLIGLDGQSFLNNNNILTGVASPPGVGVNPSGQQQHHQTFPAGFMLNARQPSNNFNLNQNINKPPLNNNIVPPPPPPIPKNLKGPAIIAVPKVPPSTTRNQNPGLIPQNNFVNNNNFQRFVPHQGINQNIPLVQQNSPVQLRPQQILPNPANRPSGNLHRGHSPILLQSLQQPHPQLPSIAQGFRPFIPHHPLGPHSLEHLISLPENAIINVEINKTLPILNGFGLDYDQPQPPQTPQFLKEVIQSNGEVDNSNDQKHEKQQPLPPIRERSTTTVANELPADLIGLPRYQRKRQFKKQKLRQQKKKNQNENSANDEDEDDDGRPLAVFVQYQHHSNRGNILNKFKPTTRPTQIPFPSDSESGSSTLNEIESSRPSSTATYGMYHPFFPDYSLSTIINMPSTTVTGSFEYPDPPTPPNYQSMNALKFPSPFEDSAEVIVKNIVPIKPRLREQPKNNGAGSMSPFAELKKRVRIGSTSTSHTPTAAESSSSYRSVTTVAAPPLPSTSAFDIETDFRDTTTYLPASIQSRDILSRIREPRPKPANTDKSFRPSPQIHSFEEPVTGIRSYITIMPPSSSRETAEEVEISKERGKKSLSTTSTKLQASDSKIPHYEQGFKPVNHYPNKFGTGTMPPPSSTTETLYFDLIREAVSNAPKTAWSEPDANGYGSDNNRLTVTASSHPYVTMGSSTSLEESFIKAGWKIRDNGDETKRPATTDSSERVEDWRRPDSPNGSSTSSKIYFGNGKFGPPNCDKFHRFGFCPMNSGYPTEQVEKIASRCSALLSHLIAPLPKADVRYDVIVAKNGSMLKGKSAAPSGWSWKSFSGKPVCDTKEIKVVPGWAKDEQGEWLVILQTKAWKQEAQITLCTPQGTAYNSCKGSYKKDCTPLKIKCVQRFTAQRLAVLDPENTDRCPVLRSVFLPSACVCLNEERGTKGKSNSGNSSLSSLVNSSEELSGSGSNNNANSVKVSASGSANSSKTTSSGGSRSRKTSKGKGSSSKGKKSSKQSKSSSSPPSGSGRRSNSRRTEENTSAASVSLSSSSEEEHKDKSGDMLDTAADSSTSAALMLGSSLPSRMPQNEDDSPEEDDTENDVSERPHAEPLMSSASEKSETVTLNEEEDGGEGGEGLNSIQNEVENDNFMGFDENSGEFGSKIMKQNGVSMNTEEDDNRVTTTIVPPPSNATNEEMEKSDNDDNNSDEEGQANITEQED